MKTTVTIVAALTVFGGVYYFSQSVLKEKESFRLAPHNTDLVTMGEAIYFQNCASCHGDNLEGQPNWRVRLANGLMPAPPHDEMGHTAHHPDDYLFQVTKYGFETVMGRPYPNDMPAFEETLSDEQIVAALSYIKSQWPQKIQQQHDGINAKARN